MSVYENKWYPTVSMLGDAEAARKLLMEHPNSLVYSSEIATNIIGQMIELELRRRANPSQNKTTEFEPGEKQKLITERDRYKNRCSDLYKLFCWYQDKFRETENV